MDDDIDDLSEGDGLDRPSPLSRLRGRSDAEIANIASVVIACVGGLLLAATCWTTVRYQQQLGPGFFFGSEDMSGAEPSLVDRLDALSNSIYGLGEAFLLFALSIGLRVLTGVLDRQSED